MNGLNSFAECDGTFAGELCNVTCRAPYVGDAVLASCDEDNILGHRKVDVEALPRCSLGCRRPKESSKRNRDIIYDIYTKVRNAACEPEVRIRTWRRATPRHPTKDLKSFILSWSKDFISTVFRLDSMRFFMDFMKNSWHFQGLWQVGGRWQCAQGYGGAPQISCVRASLEPSKTS